MEKRGVEVGYSNIYRLEKIHAAVGGILLKRQETPDGQELADERDVH